MSDQARDSISFWDMVKPGGGRLKGLNRVGKGVRMIASARFKEQLSIGQLIEKHARKHPDRLALRFENRVYSYSAFNAQANRIAHTLKRAGVGQGDTVAVLIENRPETLFAVTAIVKLGATAAMCNTKQRGDVLAHSLKTVKPAAALVGVELVDAFEEVREEVAMLESDPVWFVGEPGENHVPKGYRDLFNEAATRPADNPPDTAEVHKSQACFYIFTSGTTGMPKASVMSHGRWVKGGAGMGLTGMRLTVDDSLYCCLPLYHNNALTVSWGSVITAGASLVLARKFSASGFWDDLRDKKATAFCYIGELCRYMLKQPESPADRDHRVRVIVGNGLRPDIWDEFKNRFGIEHICEFYGASEGNLVFINGFNQDRTAGFCPLPFAVVECDMETEEPVRDADGRVKKVGKGEVGLLITKITDLAPFEGYTDDAASEKKLLRNAFEDGDSYFNTGDLVRDQGMRHIAFVDRLGDTFRWKGENVATTEVEKALNAHADIEESVVYGVEVPDADGRAGMAAITPKKDLESIDWGSLAAHLKSELPTYAVPVFLRSRPEQEVTGTFKYRKVELKKEGYSPEGDEAVFVLLPGESAYKPVDDELRKAINSGEAKL